MDIYVAYFPTGGDPGPQDYYGLSASHQAQAPSFGLLRAHLRRLLAAHMAPAEDILSIVGG